MVRFRYAFDKKRPETRVFAGFPAFSSSLPLNRCRWFTGDVIYNSVDVGHLVDNSDGDPVQDLVGDPGPVGSHEVSGGDRAEGQGVVIGAAVAHDAHGAHVG